MGKSEHSKYFILSVIYKYFFDFTMEYCKYQRTD